MGHVDAWLMAASVRPQFRHTARVYNPSSGPRCMTRPCWKVTPFLIPGAGPSAGPFFLVAAPL
jgi:hypothetical protein